MHYSCLLTIEENKKNYTKKERNMAKKTRELYHEIGNLSFRDFKIIITSNSIKNCPIMVKDIKIAEDIYGPDISMLKRKTTRTKLLIARKDYMEIPKELREPHKHVELAVDIMYVCGITLLITISRKIKYIMVHQLINRKKDTVEEAFNKVFREYNQGGFIISKIFTDPEFKPIEEDMKENDIIMEYVSAQEHVPDIERTIQTIKERFRCQYTRLPYGRIPIIMVDVLVQECAKWLNIFPPKGGISKYYLPMSILNGKQLDYEKHCKIPYGTYVQAIQENKLMNTTRPRTIGCIYLRSRLSKHVVYELMNLQSGKMIMRRKVTPIPISTDVIK